MFDVADEGAMYYGRSGVEPSSILRRKPRLYSVPFADKCANGLSNNQREAMTGNDWWPARS